ncbi:glycine zipper domain-containing protein [Desulfamplus magnetovallimortis]
MGSFVGPLGTAIGAALGGAVGHLVGDSKDNDNKKS